MNKKKILVVSYGGAHAMTLAPIVSTLQQNSQISITVIALTTGKAVFDQREIPNKGFKDYLDLENTEDCIAIEWGKELSKNIPSHPEIQQEETVAYLGFSYKELVDTLGKEAAEKSYSKNGRKVFIPLNMLKRIFNIEKPDLLLVTDSPRAERAAIEIAHRKEIFTICVPVEPLTSWTYPWLGSYKKKTYLCIPNKLIAKTYLESGWNNRNIIITGSPLYDECTNEELHYQAKKLQIENGWDKKPALIWLSREPNGLPFDFSRKIDERLADWCKKTNRSLVVRLHPSENKDLYKPIQNVYFSDLTQPLEVILGAIDVALSFNSTTLIMSKILNKYVVLLDNTLMPAFPQKPYFYEKDQIIMAWEDLERVLEYAFTEYEKTCSENKETLFPSKASDKISNLVLEKLNLLNTKPKSSEI